MICSVGYREPQTAQIMGRQMSAQYKKLRWRKWQPTSVFLPGKLHGQKCLEGYSPKGFKELDITEQLRKHACLNKSIF